MRKLLMILFSLTLTLSVGAQRITKVESQRDRLILEYEFTPQTPSSNYAITTTPQLRGGEGESVQLEPVTVRGAQNARKLHRDYRLHHKGQPEPPYVGVADVQPVRRTVEFRLADYPWIRTQELTLCVVAEKDGCCTVEQLAQECSEAFRYDYKNPYKPVVAPVADNRGRAGELEKDNPVLQHISKYRPYDKTRVLHKEEGALYVYFQLDKTILLPDYRINDETLSKIVDITRQIMADKTSSVKCIQVIGLASIEGSVAHNEWLSRERALVLQKYIQQEVPEARDDMFETIAGGEAWAEFRDQINDATEFADREALLKIIDEEPDVNKRERKLRAHNGGRSYKWMKSNILMDQRNSGFIRIYYDYVPDEAAATINKASALIQQEKYAEALPLLQSVSNDERAYNALGVALYMTGQEQLGLEYIRRAAARGNEQAKENLKGWQE